MEIKIKYLANIQKLQKLSVGDWIDLRAAEDVHLTEGQYRNIKLGVAMQLPEGYEAHVVPRSSTFKHFGLLMTNHCGIIDNSYCGDGDEWQFPAYATREVQILKNDRLCQFRIVKKQPEFEFREVNTLGNEDRGGFGSTGKN